MHSFFNFKNINMRNKIKKIISSVLVCTLFLTSAPYTGVFSFVSAYAETETLENGQTKFKKKVEFESYKYEYIYYAANETKIPSYVRGNNGAGSVASSGTKDNATSEILEKSIRYPNAKKTDYRAVPIYRAYRAGGNSDIARTLTATIANSKNTEDLKNYVNKKAKEVGTLELSDERAKKLRLVLKNGFKQHSQEAGKGRPVDEMMYYLATQILIWEVQEAKRIDFNSAYDSDSFREKNPNKWYSKHPTYWRNYWKSVYQKYQNAYKDKDCIDYYAMIVAACKNEDSKIPLATSGSNLKLEYSNNTLDSTTGKLIVNKDLFTITGNTKSRVSGKYYIGDIVFPNINGDKSYVTKKAVVAYSHPFVCDQENGEFTKSYLKYRLKLSMIDIPSKKTITVFGRTTNGKYYYIKYGKENYYIPSTEFTGSNPNIVANNDPAQFFTTKFTDANGNKTNTISFYIENINGKTISSKPLTVQAENFVQNGYNELSGLNSTDGTLNKQAFILGGNRESSQIKTTVSINDNRKYDLSANSISLDKSSVKENEIVAVRAKIKNNGYHISTKNIPYKITATYTNNKGKQSNEIKTGYVEELKYGETQNISLNYNVPTDLKYNSNKISSIEFSLVVNETRILKETTYENNKKTTTLVVSESEPPPVYDLEALDLSFNNLYDAGYVDEKEKITGTVKIQNNNSEITDELSKKNIPYKIYIEYANSYSQNKTVEIKSGTVPKMNSKEFLTIDYDFDIPNDLYYDSDYLSKINIVVSVNDTLNNTHILEEINYDNNVVSTMLTVKKRTYDLEVKELYLSSLDNITLTENQEVEGLAVLVNNDYELNNDNVPYTIKFSYTDINGYKQVEVVNGFINNLKSNEMIEVPFSFVIPENLRYTNNLSIIEIVCSVNESKILEETTYENNKKTTSIDVDYFEDYSVNTFTFSENYYNNEDIYVISEIKGLNINKSNFVAPSFSIFARGYNYEDKTNSVIPLSNDFNITLEPVTTLYDSDTGEINDAVIKARNYYYDKMLSDYTEDANDYPSLEDSYKGKIGLDFNVKLNEKTYETSTNGLLKSYNYENVPQAKTYNNCAYSTINSLTGLTDYRSSNPESAVVIYKIKVNSKNSNPNYGLQIFSTVNFNASDVQDNNFIYSYLNAYDNELSFNESGETTQDFLNSLDDSFLSKYNGDIVKEEDKQNNKYYFNNVNCLSLKSKNVYYRIKIKDANNNILNLTDNQLSEIYNLFTIDNKSLSNIFDPNYTNDKITNIDNTYNLNNDSKTSSWISNNNGYFRISNLNKELLSKYGAEISTKYLSKNAIIINSGELKEESNWTLEDATDSTDTNNDVYLYRFRENNKNTSYVLDFNKADIDDNKIKLRITTSTIKEEIVDGSSVLISNDKIEELPLSKLTPLNDLNKYIVSLEDNQNIDLMITDTTYLSDFSKFQAYEIETSTSNFEYDHIDKVSGAYLSNYDSSEYADIVINLYKNVRSLNIDFNVEKFDGIDDCNTEKSEIKKMLKDYGLYWLPPDSNDTTKWKLIKEDLSSEYNGTNLTVEKLPSEGIFRLVANHTFDDEHKQSLIPYQTDKPFNDELATYYNRGLEYKSSNGSYYKFPSKLENSRYTEDVTLSKNSFATNTSKNLLVGSIDVNVNSNNKHNIYNNIDTSIFVPFSNNTSNYYLKDLTLNENRTTEKYNIVNNDFVIQAKLGNLLLDTYTPNTSICNTLLKRYDFVPNNGSGTSLNINTNSIQFNNVLQNVGFKKISSTIIKPYVYQDLMTEFSSVSVDNSYTRKCYYLDIASLDNNKNLKMTLNYRKVLDYSTDIYVEKDKGIESLNAVVRNNSCFRSPSVVQVFMDGQCIDTITPTIDANNNLSINKPLDSIDNYDRFKSHNFRVEINTKAEDSTFGVSQYEERVLNGTFKPSEIGQNKVLDLPFEFDYSNNYNTCDEKLYNGKLRVKLFAEDATSLFGGNSNWNLNNNRQCFKNSSSYRDLLFTNVPSGNNILYTSSTFKNAYVIKDVETEEDTTVVNTVNKNKNDYSIELLLAYKDKDNNQTNTINVLAEKLNDISTSVEIVDEDEFNVLKNDSVKLRCTVTNNSTYYPIHNVVTQLFVAGRLIKINNENYHLITSINKNSNSSSKSNYYSFEVVVPNITSKLGTGQLNVRFEANVPSENSFYTGTSSSLYAELTESGKIPYRELTYIVDGTTAKERLSSLPFEYDYSDNISNTEINVGLDNLQVQFVNTFGEYKAGDEVITTCRVINPYNNIYFKNAHIKGDLVLSSGNSILSADTKNNVVVPAKSENVNGSNIYYFKWSIPKNWGGSTIYMKTELHSMPDVIYEQEEEDDELHRFVDKESWTYQGMKNESNTTSSCYYFKFKLRPNAKYVLSHNAYSDNVKFCSSEFFYNGYLTDTYSPNMHSLRSKGKYTFLTDNTGDVCLMIYKSNLNLFFNDTNSPEYYLNKLGLKFEMITSDEIDYETTYSKSASQTKYIAPNQLFKAQDTSFEKWEPQDSLRNTGVNPINANANNNAIRDLINNSDNAIAENNTVQAAWNEWVQDNNNPKLEIKNYSVSNSSENSNSYNYLDLSNYKSTDAAFIADTNKGGGYKYIKIWLKPNTPYTINVPNLNKCKSSHYTYLKVGSKDYWLYHHTVATLQRRKASFVTDNTGVVVLETSNINVDEMFKDWQSGMAGGTLIEDTVPEYENNEFDISKYDQPNSNSLYTDWLPLTGGYRQISLQLEPNTQYRFYNPALKNIYPYSDSGNYHYIKLTTTRDYWLVHQKESLNNDMVDFKTGSDGILKITASSITITSNNVPYLEWFEFISAMRNSIIYKINSNGSVDNTNNKCISVDTTKSTKITANGNSFDLASGYGVKFNINNNKMCLYASNNVESYMLAGVNKNGSRIFANGTGTIDVLYPEFGYQKGDGYSDTLYSNKTVTHYTPLWYPNGNYTVYASYNDVWTPAGQCSIIRANKQLNITDAFVNNWYLTPSM